MAFDIQGNIYAADKANHRIQKFTFNGSFLCFIGGLHDLHYPMGLTVRRNGDVIVSEYENHRLKIFSQDSLEESRTIGVQGVGAGKFACPRGIALDHNDNILVADSRNHRIQAISLSGEPLGSFGTIGLDPGCLDTPYDVVLDTTGNIIVADTKNHRLQVFTRLVPVYAEPGMYDEEYEEAAAIEDGEDLELDEGEFKIPGSDLDKELQDNTNDVSSKENFKSDIIKEKNGEDEKNKERLPSAQEISNITKKGEIQAFKEKTREFSANDQEFDANNN